ncbi:MAG: PEPxxWA-CTERM sorting domain-containing protein [Candidatus Sphingomonas colombiensis]|nr:PEPxxWA-CTERM sorting domain-containing protein [Sphingomonas sp.]WEK44270.1 MAG: PEPxxWA-CTERM sorting domain-containing protein [Sphingomonas sp.]
MMRTMLLAAVAAGGLIAGSATAQTISNAPTDGSISAFGVPNTLTYGQVFTAPVTGTLSSFTLSLNGGVGALFGGVGTWNGGSSFAFGYGSPTNLYQSANVASSGAQAFTFTPNVAVVAGQQYVAYISAFGVAGASGTTSMPGGTSAPGIDYFVWNNTSDARGNTSWNYFGDLGNALFSATFNGGVPEPATWALMILGFGAIGGALRRKRITSNVRFA